MSDRQARSFKPVTYVNEHFIVTLVKCSVVIDFNEKDLVYNKKLRLFYPAENT